MKVFIITHPHAQAAIYAACHRLQWGRHAALRYVQRKDVLFRCIAWPAS